MSKVKPHFGQRTILFSLEAISIDPFPKTEETIKTLKLSEASLFHRVVLLFKKFY